MAEGPATSSALHRIVESLHHPELVDVLASRLPGADLTTMLLEVFRRRADRLSPADVLRQYRTDRFVAPGSVSFTALRRAEDVMLAALPDDFEVVTLAPVLPLGAHSAVASVDPRNVIATIRRTEVAADPTNGLALEAAVRWRAALDREPASASPVRLAATQRVARAQLVSGPVSFAHFQLLGMVTAGRDTGGRSFERQHLAEQLRAGALGVTSLGAQTVRIALTCLDPVFDAVLAQVSAELAGIERTEIVLDPGRSSGRAYYRGACFKVHADFGTGWLEVADGGFTDWIARLLGSRKERLLISGYGVDRLALLSQTAPA